MHPSSWMLYDTCGVRNRSRHPSYARLAQRGSHGQHAYTHACIQGDINKQEVLARSSMLNSVAHKVIHDEQQAAASKVSAWSAVLWSIVSSAMIVSAIVGV